MSKSVSQPVSERASEAVGQSVSGVEWSGVKWREVAWSGVGEGGGWLVK